MFTLREILLLALLPGLIGFLVPWLAWRRKHGVDTAPAAGWAAALAIGGGMLAAGVLTGGVHGRPREAMDWLPLLPGMALLLGVLTRFAGPVPGVALVAAGGALSAWLLAVPGIATGDALATAAAPGVLYALLAPLARRSPGAAPVAAWLIVAAATTCVSLASSGITFGKYSMALTAVVAGVLVAALLVRNADLSHASLAVLVLIWTAMLIYGYEWVDMPRWRVLVLLAAPLAMWLAELPGLRGRSSLLRAFVTLTAVAALAATAALPAARELLETLRSQTQVGGYDPSSTLYFGRDLPPGPAFVRAGLEC